MAGTILGKRNRASESSTASTSISSRVKRRAQIHIHHDDNVQSESLQNTKSSEEQSAWNDQVSENSHHVRDNNSKRRRVSDGRAALSPCKANGQAQAVSATKDVTEDEHPKQLPTPKTPRHRDALSKKVPITPQHRIGLVRRLLTPRSSHTPSKSGTSQSLYDTARQLFARSTDSGQIVGRAEERSKLQNLILRGIESSSGNCSYVSGPPGTGKSALVSDVCRQFGTRDGVCTAFINCMSFKSSGEVYRKLIDELLGDEQLLEHDDLEELRAMFLPKKNKDSPIYVVVLDEIDHLLSTDLEALYTLFEWSLQRSSKLIVVGIANALDLTDRFLPRLRAKNLKPEILPFSPYTAHQIAEVVTIRLQSLLPSGDDTCDQANFIPFVHPAAIQLCSKKVALQTGDLRKAFDIIRRSIDIIMQETIQKLEREANPQDLELSPSKEQILEIPSHSRPNLRTDLTVLTAPRATIAHVSRISAAAFSNGTTKRLSTLNLQQKAALCALIAHQKASYKGTASIFNTPTKTAHTAPPTIRKLHTTYSGLCRKDNALHPLTVTEFIDVISGLETLGLVSDEKKGGSFGMKIGTPSRRGKSMGGVVAEERRVVCFVDEKEVEECLTGPGGNLLRGLLDGNS